MPPKTDTDKLLAELVATNKTLAETMQSNLQAQKARDERDDMIYNFLFVGDPAKGVPPFVTETRDQTKANTDWIAGYKRVMWIAATALIGGLVTAAFAAGYVKIP